MLFFKFFAGLQSESFFQLLAFSRQNYGNHVHSDPVSQVEQTLNWSFDLLELVNLDEKKYIWEILAIFLHQLTGKQP